MEFDWDSGESPVLGYGFKFCLCSLPVVKLYLSASQTEAIGLWGGR